MTDELQKHLDKGLYGAPLLKPDEQKKYLGTFRERCYISMTAAQMTQAANQKQLADHLKNYPDSSILINGSLPENLQSSYIQLAMKANLPFTVVAVDETYHADSIGLLVAAKEAVNEKTIDIEQKFAPASQPSAVKEKKSFWNKLFH